MKLSERQFRRLRSRRGMETPKYRNTATVVHGLRFDSKLEARRYGELVDLQADGLIAWFIRQPSFDLAGGIRYRADFLVVWNNLKPYSPVVMQPGTAVSVEDCKGVETPAFKLKRKLFLEAYPLAELRILTAKDVRR